MKNIIYHTCKLVRHTKSYIKGVIIFITKAPPVPHKIRISLYCPKLKKKNHGVGLCTINMIDTYVCKRKTVCFVRA